MFHSKPALEESVPMPAQSARIDCAPLILVARCRSGVAGFQGVPNAPEASPYSIPRTAAGCAGAAHGPWPGS